MNDHELISRLRASGRATLRPERANMMRQALLAELTRVTPSTEPRLERVSGFIHSLTLRPMIATAIATIILAVGFGATAIANTARPGDPLFNVDTAAERIRLALTFGDEARAVYEARTAEERLIEKLELEAEHSDHADDATRIAGQTLDRAISTIDRVKIKLEGKDASGAEALAKVEVRLRGLRDDHIGRIKVEAETEKGATKIKVESGRSKWEWRTTAMGREDLLAEIAARTGLLIDDLRAALVLKFGDEEGDDSSGTVSDQNVNGTSTPSSNQNVNASNANKNTNVSSNSNRDDRNVDVHDDSRNTNTNTNLNQNTNSGDDDDDDGQDTIEVRVDLEDEKTEIHARVNGIEQDWDIDATDQAAILASIITRTGLTSVQITDIWDFEQH